MFAQLIQFLLGQTVTRADGTRANQSRGLLTSKSTLGALIAALGFLAQQFGWQIGEGNLAQIAEALMIGGGALLSVIGLRTANMPFGSVHMPEPIIEPVKITRPRKPRGPNKPKPAPAADGAQQQTLAETTARSARIPRIETAPVHAQIKA